MRNLFFIVTVSYIAGIIVGVAAIVTIGKVTWN